LNPDYTIADAGEAPRAVIFGFALPTAFKLNEAEVLGGYRREPPGPLEASLIPS
jgi:hypothetical protein